MVLLVGGREGLFTSLFGSAVLVRGNRVNRPGNVVLQTVEAGDGSAFLVAKIVDFGTSKMASSANPTRLSTLVFTPGYAAPEQRWPVEYGHYPRTLKMDVFAFGQTMGRCCA